MRYVEGEVSDENMLLVNESPYFSRISDVMSSCVVLPSSANLLIIGPPEDAIRPSHSVLKDINELS